MTPEKELHGHTVGFIGFGDIAQCTAQLCRPVFRPFLSCESRGKAFGMRVIAWRNRKNLKGEELCDLVTYASDGPQAKEDSDT